ncbi:MAG: metallophosphoesterase family protein [Anaerolinea sp.]|nr:metallophosphoesterase family protein [Anaerolinea sp.]
MKTLVLSDIHSNIYALEAIWARERDCDVVYCAGDLVDYGPYPKEVLAWIQGQRVPCVQGNHDLWVTMQYRQGNTLDRVPEAERAWVHHNAGLLDEAEIAYLEQLPQMMTFELDGVQYGLTHLYQEYKEIVSLHAYAQFCTERFDNAAFTRLILGHTHRQAVRYLSDELLWLNPGSVSYRRHDDPDQTAHYTTIVDGRISLHRLDYDLAPLYYAVQQVTLKEEEMKATTRFFGARARP